MAFIVAFLRQKQRQIKSFSTCVSEAAMCAFLSTGLGQFAVYAFDFKPEISMFIGTFMGFLGTDYIRILIRLYIRSRLNNKRDEFK